jgi:hypothetical protein
MISLCNLRGHEHIAIVTNYMGNKVSSKDGESHATGMPL